MTPNNEPRMCLNCAEFNSSEAKCGLCCGPTASTTRWHPIIQPVKPKEQP